MTGRKAAPEGGSVGGTGQVVQVVRFSVSGRDYALDIMRLKEVIAPPEPTPIPGAPDCVVGIIELRGRFLPVVDLRQRFAGALPAGDPGAPSPSRAIAGRGGPRCMIVDLGGRAAGLLVDAVTEVDRFAGEEISPAPVSSGRQGARFFAGLVMRDGAIVLVVDADALFTADELAAMMALEERST